MRVSDSESSKSESLSKSDFKSESASESLSKHRPPQMEPNSESKSVPSRNHCLSRSLSRSLSLSHPRYREPACGTRSHAHRCMFVEPTVSYAHTDNFPSQIVLNWKVTWMTYNPIL